MPLESSVTTATDLNASWPLGTDDPVDGDNHIRYCKTAIKSNETIEAAHEADVANPHSVTGAQLSLGTASVADLGTASGDAAEGDHTHTAPTIQAFTASGTWTKPSGCRAVKVTVVGGGGGGHGLEGSNSGAGGGGGGTAIKYIDVSAISSETVTVGAGGAAENAGGDSSFGAHCTGNGGLKSTSWYGKSGGTASGGDVNITGGKSDGGKGTNKGGRGGDSMMGFGGGAEDSDGGNDATGYGGGGSGAYQGASYVGGAGSDGIVTVEEYY